jgi:hypothetical protein
MPIRPFLAGSLTGAMLATAADGGVAGTLTDAHWHLSNRPGVTAPQLSGLQGVSIDPTVSSRSTPPWMVHLENNVIDLALLSSGWDGPGSIPVSSSMLYRAARYVRTALDSVAGATSPRLVPGGDGSIQIEWHAKHGELEFDIGPGDEMTIWIRDRRNGAEFDGENQAALALFYRWAPWISAPLRDGSDAVVQNQMPFFSIAA